jgi:DNA polymerase III delta subunit
MAHHHISKKSSKKKEKRNMDLRVVKDRLAKEIADALSRWSSEALLNVAKRATALAADLKAGSPTIALALEAGVRDNSYSTVRWGVDKANPHSE